jgi:very-short-patch-repair endonuclease
VEDDEMHWEARLRRLAARQEGTIGIHQMAALGGDHRWWTNARRNHRWDSLSDNVLRLDGWPATGEQRAFAGVLDAGPSAFLFGESALAWFGVRNRRLEPVAVGRRRGTSNRPGRLASVHRLRDVGPGDIVVVRGLPVLAPLRAVWAEAARLAQLPLEWSVPRVARALDDLHRARLVRWEELHQSLTNLGRRGRAGTTIMRILAADRRPGASATESRLEDRFESVIEEGGGVPMKPQTVVGGDRPVGRTDFRAEDLPMVAEVNSVTFHTTPSDRDADRRRYGELLAAGFSVAVIWEHDLWSNTADVVRVVEEARAAARAGRPRVVHSASCPWPEDCRGPIW